MIVFGQDALSNSYAINGSGMISMPLIGDVPVGGLTTADAAKRAEAYKVAQAQIWKDAPWIFLVSDDNVAAKSKKLSGVYVLPDGQMLTEDASLN